MRYKILLILVISLLAAFAGFSQTANTVTAKTLNAQVHIYLATTRVDSITNDPNLLSNSPNMVPTEAAVVAYIKNAPKSNIYAQNGLTALNDSTFQWGGRLIQNTTFSASTFSLVFDSLTNFSLKLLPNKTPSGTDSVVFKDVNGKVWVAPFPTLTQSTGISISSSAISANLSTGISGNQSTFGSTSASGSLFLNSTTNSAKGVIGFGNLGTHYDEANNYIQILHAGLTSVNIADSTGLTLLDTSAATLGNQKTSPALVLASYGWSTVSSTSILTKWEVFSNAVQGVSAPTNNLIFGSSINNSAPNPVATLTSLGIFSAFQVGTNTGTVYMNPSLGVVSNGFIRQADTTMTFKASGFTGNAITLTNASVNSSIVGISNFLLIQPSFAPISGNGIHNSLAIEPIINQTGGSNGNTRGIFIHPTLTAASNFIAIQSDTGAILFKAIPSASGTPTLFVHASDSTLQQLTIGSGLSISGGSLIATGGGGGGSLIPNGGSGYRLVNYNSQLVKSLTCTGCTLDSATTNQIGITVPSSALARQNISSGTTATVTGGRYLVQFNFSSTISAFNLTTPAAPADQDIVEIQTGNTLSAGTVEVTSFTLTANSGQTFNFGVPINTIVSGDNIKIRYNTSGAFWDRVY